MRDGHSNVLTEMRIDREMDMMQMQGSSMKLFTYKNMYK